MQLHEEDMPRWELRTTVLECVDLPKMDTIGKNDVYATVNVEGLPALRTMTVEDGGAMPVWKDGEGLLALVLGAAPTALGIRVFDEDVGSADDVIGTAVLPLGPALHYPAAASAAGGGKGPGGSEAHHSTRVEWELPPTWLELTAPDGKHKKDKKSAGRVRIQVSWGLTPTAEAAKTVRPWTPEQAHFWATDTSQLLDNVDSFLFAPDPDDEDDDEDVDEEEEAAATKIQAVQ